MALPSARLATTPVTASAFNEAVRAARQADAVIIAVGETAEMSGEAASRTSLDLPGRQLELIQAIHATGKPYVVVGTKSDRVSGNILTKNLKALLEEHQIERVLPFSTKTGKGKEELWQAIRTACDKHQPDGNESQAEAG